MQETDSGGCADPNSSVAVFQKSENTIVCQSGIGCINGKAIIAAFDQTGSGQGNPEISVPIFDQIVDRVLPEFFRIDIIKSGEIYAVKTNQTFKSAEPQITVPRFDNRANGILH